MTSAGKEYYTVMRWRDMIMLTGAIIGLLFTVITCVIDLIHTNLLAAFLALLASVAIFNACTHILNGDWHVDEQEPHNRIR